MSKLEGGMRAWSLLQFLSSCSAPIDEGLWYVLTEVGYGHQKNKLDQFIRDQHLENSASAPILLCPVIPVYLALKQATLCVQLKR